MQPDAFEHIAALFWKTYGALDNVQVCGIESAGIPLVAGLVNLGHAVYQKNVTGFFIRKSRKKDGLLKMVEGQVHNHVPVIIVDDLTNTGSSILRQIEVVEALGLRVSGIFTIVRFRDADFYEPFQQRGIELYSIFDLDDFTDTLKTKNISSKEQKPPRQDFRASWKFSGGHPTLHLVMPKSDPALDDTRVYMGTDDGVMYALNQTDGSIAWSFKTMRHVKGKGIFSCPIVHDGVVYFGAYDGNMYALDAVTGKRLWVSVEADWIGSSPALAPELGLVFIGLEFGIIRKRGGIAALDMKTGQTKWIHRDMPCFTHASPLYIPGKKQVAIGSNDGIVRLFDAQTGTLKWQCATGDRALEDKESDSGFSAFDIKKSLAYDAKRDRIIAANMHGRLCAIERKTGEIAHSFAAEFGFYSTPVITDDRVLAASLDKRLYCIDLASFEVLWEWHATARIFATPTLLDGSIFIGSNAGRMVELDPATGTERTSFTVTERITNQVAHNPHTHRFFLSTYANELYCLERIVPQPER